jgi:hypothetical protein
MVVTKKPKPKQDDEEQSKKFIDAAKQLEADESGETFDRALSIITPKTLPDKAATKPPPKRGRPPKGSAS